MKSLSACIREAGKALNASDARAITDMRDGFIADGLDPTDAAINAIDEYLVGLRNELQDITDRVEAQGAAVPGREKTKSAIIEQAEAQNAELDESGGGTLAGVPADEIQGATEEGPTGAESGAAPGSAPDVEGDRTTGGGGADVRGSLSIDQGELFVSPTGTRSDPGPRNGGVAGQTTRLDYTITKDDAIGSGGDKTKFRNNIAAIQTLKALEREERYATTEEQAILAKYVGWGGLPQAFFREDGTTRKGWDAEATQLKEELNQQEYEAARRSTQDAHYTSPEVVAGIYAGLERLGFKGGKILEPSLGTGNFFGLMPASMRKKSKLTGVELDNITGGIAKQLYQNANIHSPTGFEDFGMSDGSFDVAIGNPPFGNQPIYDKIRPDISKFSIHNYFFGKSLAGLRDNGVLAMVVSSGLMDKLNSKQRKYIAGQAELLGAVRLPNTAFKANAGTSVTTDILFLRKLAEDESGSTDWTGTETITGGDGTDIRVNSYFAKNPDMMLGEMRSEGSMYSPNEPALIAAEDQDTGALLQEAIKALPEGVYQAAPRNVAPTAPEITEDQGDTLLETPINGIYLDDGVLKKRLPDINGEARGTEYTEKINSKGLSVPLKQIEIDRISGMVTISRTLSRLIRAQMDESSTEAQLSKLRADLNRQYDAFKKKNGPINRSVNKSLFADDPMWPRLAALETDYDKGLSSTLAKRTGKPSRKPSAKKADIFRKRTQTPYRPVTKVSTSKEGLVVSLSQRGKLDLEHIQQLTGKTEAQVIKELSGLIFKDPVDGWVTADEYLSGNVKHKLYLAKAAADNYMGPGDATYEKNVRALEKVIPKDIEAADINVKIGAGWVSPQVMSDFVDHLAGAPMGVQWSYAAPIAQWGVTSGSLNERLRTEWGTPDKNAVDLIKAVANNRAITVTKSDGEGGTYTDKNASAAAMSKANEIKAEFEDWLWRDQGRRESLGKVYNDTQNTTIGRTYDGSHLDLPGMSSVIELRPHQKNFIWRALQSTATLADHVVGAGKTFALIGAAMEMRRTGLVNKPMLAVPNHLVKQWAVDFMKLYPNANVLVPTKKDFEKTRRKELFARIATGDWDAVIVAHSSFKKLPSDAAAEQEFIKQQVKDLEESMAALSESEGKGARSVKILEKQKDRLKEKLKEMVDIKHQDEGLNFHELGVDALFVDEAHEFKNLSFSTKMARVAGVGTPDAKKASDMFIKTQGVLGNNGRVVFATGTPISNSITEMYTLQRYLGYKRLQERGLTHFDAWANTFGEVVTDFELDATGVGYRMNSRFNKFVNMPELMQQYFEYADHISGADIVAMMEEQGKVFPVPKIKGGTPRNLVVPRSEAIADYMETIVDRATNMSGVDPSEDNMLKVTNDARKAAVDIRLIDPYAPADMDSKINAITDEAIRIYNQWNDDLGTQLVFHDLSSPRNAKIKAKRRLDAIKEKAAQGDEAAIATLESYTADEISAMQSTFSVYDELKAQMVASGIPAEEIAFMHDATTDDQKNDLFDRVKAGDIRVLMGSTALMGAGMNVQERLVALHHMDAPWKPSDIEQREGRILRQGNHLYDKYPGFEVEIIRYATEQTYDSRMWQTIESKARFIEQVRRGDLASREVEDIDGQSASAAEMKAAASGNPLILEEYKLRSEVARLEGLEKQHNRKVFGAEDRLKASKRRLEYLPDRIEQLQKDMETIAANPFPLDKDGQPVVTVKIGDKSFTDRKRLGNALLIELHRFMKTGKDTVEIGTMNGMSVGFSRINASSASLDLTGVLTQSNTLTDINELVAEGIARRLTNLPNEFQKGLTNARGDLKEETRHSKELEALDIGEFKYKDELKKAREDQRAILAELSKDNNTDQTDIEGDVVLDASVSDAGSTVAEIEDYIRGIAENWSGPSVTVVQSMSDLPQVVLDRMKRQGVDAISGYADWNTRSAYLVADSIGSAEDAQKTLLHEMRGHIATRAFLGDDQYASLLNQIERLSQRDGVVRKAASIVDSLYSGLTRGERAEEILAKVSETAPRHGIVVQAVAWVRRALRKMGFTVKFSKAELMDVLIRTDRALSTGQIKGGSGAPGKAMFSAISEVNEQRVELNKRVKEKHKTIWDKVKQELKRQLTPGGLLPKDVFDAKIMRDGEMNAAQMDTTAFNIRLEKAVRLDFGKTIDKMSEAELNMLAGGLKGNLDGLPERTAKALEGMRQYIDRYSEKYKDILFEDAMRLMEQSATEGLNRKEKAALKAKAELLQIVAGNVGTYVHRSYRAFDDPQWIKKIDDAVLNNARDYLEGEGSTPDQAQAIIQGILKDGTAYESMESMIKESKLGAKDLNILKKRKDIAPEIRALLGEYTDPRLNFTKSVTKMSRLIFNDDFLKKVKEVGMGVFLFDERQPDAFDLINPETDSFSPLGGLYTYPEIKQAFSDALDQGDMNDWYRSWVRVNGMVKYGKTVLSPTTAARNFMSAFFFSMANGHFNLSKAAESFRSMPTYFAGEGGRLGYLKELRRLGVVYDSPYAGEMLKLLEDSELQEKYLTGQRMTVKKVLDTATKFYQYGDDFWKIIGWENEIDILMKSRKITRKEAKPLAAERIRNTYPTYSMTGMGVQKLRRFPLMGTFVSFPAEIIRTSFNMLKYAQEDMKHDKALGMRRVAGLSIASGAAYALQEMMKNLIGVGDDEEEAIRELSPPWSRNSNLMFLGRDRGEIQYLDLSFLDPYNYWKRPITALMRDEPIEDTAVEVAREMLTPFFGQDIAFGAIMDVWNNKKDSGGRVYNPADTGDRQAMAIAGHLMKAVRPGVLANADRMWSAIRDERSPSGKKYRVGDEMAAIMGFRVTTLDPKIALFYRSYEFSEQMRDASSILNTIARNPNEVDDDDIMSAYHRADAVRAEAFKDMIQLVGSARKSGLQNRDILRLLRGAGISKRNAWAIVNERVPKWRPSNTFMRSAIKRADSIFDPETKAAFEKRREMVLGSVRG